jgi:hypothetical protein
LCGHLRRHAEEERDFYLGLGMDEARIEGQTKRMVEYSDEIAAAKAHKPKGRRENKARPLTKPMGHRADVKLQL